MAERRVGFPAGLAVVLALVGCAGEASLLDPPAGPASGYYRVVAHLATTGIEASSVTTVKVGGIAAYDVESGGSGDLAFTVQGRAQGGPADVVVTAAGVDITLPQPFVYTAPSDPRLARVMSFGASLSQGIQQTIPSLEGTLMSPAAQLARQAGVFMPLPLPIRGLFPRLKTSDVGPPPTCALPNAVSVLLKCLGDVVPRLLDDEGTAYVAWKGRVDPDLAPGNVAVGNCSVREVAAGIDDGNLAGVMLGHLVYDPFAEVMAPVKGSQIGLIEAAKPTLVLSVDFFGNDVLWGVVMGSVIDTSYCTPADVMLPAIEEIVSRLAATGAEVFLANLPGTSMLPATAERRRQSIEAGVTDVDARIAAIDALGEAANAALAAAAAKHANVHVVDLVTWADRIARDGLPVGDQVLTTGKFGGLVGLDGIHFTSTGYAVVANVFADAINATLGTAIPLIDLAAVVAGDPESPQALAAAGLAECVAGGPSGLSSPR